MLNIRPVTPDDIDAVLELARAMHAESPRFRGHTFLDEKAVRIIAHLIDTGGGFIAERDGELVGMIGGLVVEHFFSADKYATDLVVYVIPRLRGSTIAIRLIKTFETWAFAQGAADVHLGVSTGIEPERTVCVYERLGYTLSAYSLRKSGK